MILVCVCVYLLAKNIFISCCFSVCFTMVANDFVLHVSLKALAF